MFRLVSTTSVATSIWINFIIAIKNTSGVIALSFASKLKPSSFPSHSYTASLDTFTALSNHFKHFVSIENSRIMPRNVKKENLPTKICVICNRPFTWRKKWERVWDEGKCNHSLLHSTLFMFGKIPMEHFYLLILYLVVSTCSKSCNSKRRSQHQIENRLVKYENANMVDLNLKTGDLNLNQAVINGFDILANQDLTQDYPTKKSDKMERNIAPTEKMKEEIMSLDNNLSAEYKYSDSDRDISSLIMQSKTKEQKEERKKAKKLMKAKRRAEREGRGDPTAGQKKCDICNRSVDLLIRCTTDQTKVWRMVCGKCWNDVSGGVVDGDSTHPHYCYGGLWKNRRAQK